jgi:hypothetical protein
MKKQDGAPMRKSLFCLIIITVFMLLLSNSEVYAQEKFIPVHVGEKFTYSVTDGINNNWTQKFHISGTTNVPCLNRDYFLVDGIYKYQGVPLDNAKFVILRSSLTKKGREDE